MIHLLVAEPSPRLRAALIRALCGSRHLNVIGETGSAAEAAGLTELLKPDLVVLDLCEPEGAGVEAVTEIMASVPTPILLLTRGSSEAELLAVRDAVRQGAVEFLEIPGEEPALWGDFGAELVRQAQIVSRIKVIRHLRPKKPEPVCDPPEEGRTLLAIGASTGGPKAVMTILKALPRDFAGAICLVQHIADGCDVGFAQWLNGECTISVRIAADGDLCRPGQALIAPTGSHMTVSFGRVRLTGTPPINCCRPSIDVFFESLAQEPCRHVVGVLLTGMGKDGARGMLALRQRGGLTIVQDEGSCAIFGMPKAAIHLGAAEEILPLHGIARAIPKIFGAGRAADLLK